MVTGPQFWSETSIWPLKYAWKMFKSILESVDDILPSSVDPSQGTLCLFPLHLTLITMGTDFPNWRTPTILNYDVRGKKALI